MPACTHSLTHTREHNQAWARATSLEAAAQGGDGEAAEALRDVRGRMRVSVCVCVCVCVCLALTRASPPSRQMCWFGYYAPTARAWVVARDGAQFVNHCGDDGVSTRTCVCACAYVRVRVCVCVACRRARKHARSYVYVQLR